MPICTIGVNHNVDRNVIARLGPVHRRLFNRIKAWNPALRNGAAVQPAHSADFRCLLKDPEGDPVDVANALVDLREQDLVDIEVTNEAAFRREMENAARTILMEQAGLTSAN